MSIYDQKRLPEIVDRCGNIFAAVNYVAAETRKRMKDVNSRHLTEQSAMTWVITGETPPEILEETKPKPKQKPVAIAAIHNLLSQCDDQEVQDAVMRSVLLSRKEHHLLYEYLSVQDDGRMARVRVLTNMIWYALETIQEVTQNEQVT